MAVSFSDKSADEETDLGTLWQEALINYYEESGTDLRSLPASHVNLNHIKAEQEHQLLLFSNYRHDKGKLDKLRTLVAKNSDIIISVATHIANAASSAFPPSAAILTAFNYVMNASRAVSEDYDMIVSFFDVMNSFLERISMLESRMPGEWQFRRFLVNVFSAMMTLSAIARKCRLKGRLSKWAKALIDGSDPKLKGAFDSLHMHLQRFESVTMLTTLKHTLDSGRKLDFLGQDVKEIQDGVKKTQAGVERNLLLSQQNYAVGLESKGYAKDASSTSHEILAVVTRQEEQGAEYASGLYQVIRTLNKISNTNNQQQEKLVDAGSRRSIAMRTLETLLCYNLDDKVDFTSVESHYIDGTYSWFLTQDVYKNFEAGKARLVWMSGPAGMGKSTLAYTIVRALQDELVGDSVTTVAHFFFREDGNRRSVSQMLCSCALQVAIRDNSYREAAVAEVQVYEKRRPGIRIIGDGINKDEAKMWELLLQTKFTKKSGRRLLLVLDGVDEIHEKDRKYMRMILEDISSSEDMNIQVLFSSDPGSFAPEHKTKVLVFEMTKELILTDMRVIIIARLRKSGRLRKLPQRTRRKIIARLSHQADTMRYIEHMLRRLEQLGGSETAVLRQLKDLPSSTSALYQTILQECQKARTDQELIILKKFFAWLAYATKPLYLGCARMLLNYIAPDNNISIDEELENRCSRILRLSNTAVDQEDEEDYDGSDVSTNQSHNEYLVENNDDDDGDVGDFFVVVSFQEKGLRSYFRPLNNPVSDRLRTSESSAHVIILDIIQSILCSDTGLQTDHRERALHVDAVTSWARHLQAINPAEISEEETACVIESICNILSNKSGSIRKMESICRPWGSTGLPCVLGKTDEDIENMLACLQQWAVRAATISPSRLSGATEAWMRLLARTPHTLFIKLADAHVTNWLANYDHTFDKEVNDCYLFAHYALYRGRHLPAVQKNTQLRSYFMERADRGDMSEGIVIEESFSIVSRAFPHINMTAQSYLSVAVAMLYNGLRESCLKQLDLAIRQAETDIERMEIYTRIAEIHIILADSKRQNTRDGDPGTVGTDDTEHGVCGDAGDGEDECNLARNFDKQSREAMKVISKAADIASSLTDRAMEDNKVKNIVHAVWMLKARAEIMRGDASKTAAYCRRAIQATPGDGGLGRFSIIPSLAETKSWSAFPEVIKVLSGAGLLGMILDDYVHEIHTAAKVTGETDYVLEAYRTGVSTAHEAGVSGFDIRLMVNWAQFYHEVVGTLEAISKAKTLFNKAIDAKVSYYIPKASFSLSDILLEEFRVTTQLKKKMTIYNEMRDLVKRVSESMGSEFDPSQSQTAIPLAHMAQKIDPVAFHQGLERTFDGCVAALTDETGWNDVLSLRVLARVLALVGLERDAQIAATCQVYVLDMEIFKQENGGRIVGSYDDGGARNSESQGGNDDEDEPPDDAEGDLNWETGGVRCSDCNKLALKWSEGPVYLCYYCTEVDLCRGCFDKRAKRIAGEPTDDENWQIICREGHRHIQMPVQGWKTLANGVMKIADTEVPFHDWLVEVKEKKWPDVWERFWSNP